jgi:hypothetical protein
VTVRRSGPTRRPHLHRTPVRTNYNVDMKRAPFDQQVRAYDRPIATWWLDPERRMALDRLAELHRRPIVAVLDTSCVRTGLAYQLKNGVPPASLRTVQEGMVRLFMERDTLKETCGKLPVFADQLGVPPSQLVEMFETDWLPYIRVVALPDHLRELDERAAAVHLLDADDYPTAALAALLSPCILLTHNYKHFRPLGIRGPSQGVSAVIAAIDVTVGERRFQALATVPVAPIVAVGVGAKWVADRIGLVVWVIVGLLIVVGVVAYQRQPPERKDTIKRVAGDAGRFLLEEGSRAVNAIEDAQERFDSYVVPAPGHRTVTAAVLRELAMASESLSAQQLSDALDVSVRPAVPALRVFLHANKTTVFREARRGSFLLGMRYSIRARAEP